MKPAASDEWEFNEVESEQEFLDRDRREAEVRARTYDYTHQRVVRGASLIALERNDQGWFLERPYEGGPYDSSKFRMDPAGWDHERCFICWTEIEEGETWWPIAPGNREIGLCESCYARLIGAELEKHRIEKEKLARAKQYTHEMFEKGPSLVDLTPNEEGWVASSRYSGDPYDPSKCRIEPFGWDHSHCDVCRKRIEHGDTWWPIPPYKECGLCEECHARLFRNSESADSERI